MLAALQRDGVAVTTAEALIGPEMWADLQAATAERVAESERLLRLTRQGAIRQPVGQRAVTVNKASYLVKLLGDRPVWEAGSIWTRITSAPALVDLAAAYLPSQPHVKAFNVWLTVPARSGPRDSQLWHQDGDDATILKLFLYLSDVTDDAGPLTYIPGTHAGQPHAAPGTYDYAGIQRVTDADMAKVAPLETWRALTGAVGTAVLVDTTGWHKGGHGTVDRLVYTAMWTTRPAPYGCYYRRP